MSTSNLLRTAGGSFIGYGVASASYLLIGLGALCIILVNAVDNRR